MLHPWIHCWFSKSPHQNLNPCQTVARGLQVALGSPSWTGASLKRAWFLRGTRSCCCPETSSWAGWWRTLQLWISSPCLALLGTLGWDSPGWLTCSDPDAHGGVLKHLVVYYGSWEGYCFHSCTYSFARPTTDGSFCAFCGLLESISSFLRCGWDRGEIQPYCVQCRVT